MRIRSVTIGANVSYPVEVDPFRAFGQFQARARALFADAGLEVQSVRLATQPFPEILRDKGPTGAVTFAKELETLCQAHGIDYCSVGPVVVTRPEDDPEYMDIIPAIIQQTETVFASALVAASGSGIHLAAIQRAASVIAEIAHSTPQGFGNLRFAVLANCGPGSPFFPAAFHQEPGPSFSIATEAADLAVDAFARAATLEKARENLWAAVDETARVIWRICRALKEESGFRFGGIDFSLAPYPEQARSIGHAIERLGVDAFGGNATLFAVAFATQALQQAQFPHCGFSGLLLPVLEDWTLAERSAGNLFTLDSLLLYSAVCGTGLDTIPLPGDVTVEELAAILLDVATLAVVLDKPLTARLIPVPGKKAGDMTDFDFPYFANARVLDTRGHGGSRIFENNHFVDLHVVRVRMLADDPAQAIHEIQQCVALQKAVGWENEIAPPHVLRADSMHLVDNSLDLGYVLVTVTENKAKEEEIVGFARVTHTADPTCHWLHEVVTSPHMQSRGIAHALMMKIREVSRGQGAQKLLFTYDPLEGQNGRLYLTKCGARAVRVYEDLYGEITSPAHGNRRTHRFLVRWNLQTDRPKTQEEQKELEAAPVITRPDELGDHLCVKVEIPYQVEGLSFEEARRWQVAVFPILVKAINGGYQATHVQTNKEEKKNFLVLETGHRL